MPNATGSETQIPDLTAKLSEAQLSSDKPTFLTTVVEKGIDRSYFVVTVERETEHDHGPSTVIERNVKVHSIGKLLDE